MDDLIADRTAAARIHATLSDSWEVRHGIGQGAVFSTWFPVSSFDKRLGRGHQTCLSWSEDGTSNDLTASSMSPEMS